MTVLSNLALSTSPALTPLTLNLHSLGYFAFLVGFFLACNRISFCSFNSLLNVSDAILRVFISQFRTIGAGSLYFFSKYSKKPKLTVPNRIATTNTQKCIDILLVIGYTVATSLIGFSWDNHLMIAPKKS